MAAQALWVEMVTTDQTGGLKDFRDDGVVLGPEVVVAYVSLPMC